MSGARTLILNGLLQGNLDCAGFKLLNVQLDDITVTGPFIDNVALIFNASDPTKLVRFNLSGQTTGTTRVLTPPNYNGTLATLAGTEALTNKTYNGLTITGNGGLNFTDGVLRLSNEFIVNSTVSLTLNTTAETILTLPTSGTLTTLTNTERPLGNPGVNGYVLSSTTGGLRSWVANAATANPFSDLAALVKNKDDATKLLRFDLGDNTTGTTRVIKPPNYNGTMATLDGTENFTNKLYEGLTITETSGSSLSIENGIGIHAQGDLNIGPGGLTTQGAALFFSSGGTFAMPASDGTLALAEDTEPALGNPASNGFVLSSTTAGVRSWVAKSAQPFSDLAALIMNNGDPTKTAKFSLSGLTTGTLRVYTMPNYDGTLATLGGSETFTNKTLVNTASLGVLAESGGFDLQIYPKGALTANRVLNIIVNDATRTIDISGNLTLAGPLITVGAFGTTLTATATTALTLPTTGTVEARVAVPASAAAAGIAGQIAYDASFEYRCIASGNWVRNAHATW